MKSKGLRKQEGRQEVAVTPCPWGQVRLQLTRAIHAYACVYVRTYSIVACKLTSWRPNQSAWVLDGYVRTHVCRRLHMPGSSATLVNIH